MKRLVRPREHRMIAGVCLGIAYQLDVDPLLIRIAFLLTLLPGGVPGLLLYAACWLFIPSEKA